MSKVKFTTKDHDSLERLKDLALDQKEKELKEQESENRKIQKNDYL